MKRYLKKPDKETIDYKMKLSAFKEAVNILLLTYITGVANTLKVKLKTSVPKFVSFQNIEFVEPALLSKYSKLEGLVSVGQFKITRESKIRARFLVLY